MAVRTTPTVTLNGYALAAIRTLAGVRRSQVAAAMDLHVSRISRLETGASPNLPYDRFRVLAEFFKPYGIDHRAFLATPPAGRRNEEAA